jgi:hypothetical protein
MTLALVINATAAIALTLLLAGHETQPLEAIAAMAAKRGEYPLGVRAAVWCERRDRATMRAPRRPPVARAGPRQRLRPAAEHPTQRPLAGWIRK